MKRHTKKRQPLAEINTNFTPLKKNDVKRQQFNLLKVEDLKTPPAVKKSKSMPECESIDCVLNLLLNSIELLKKHQSLTAAKNSHRSVQTQTEPQKNSFSTNNENVAYNMIDGKKITKKQKLIQSNDSLSLSSETIQFLIDASHFGQKLKKIDDDF